MAEKTLRFDVSEFRERVRRVKERMDAKGIEVLFLVDPASMNYLTGYDG